MHRGHLRGPPDRPQSGRQAAAASYRALRDAPRFVAEDLARLASTNVYTDRLVFESPEGMPVRATLFRRRFWAPAVDAAGLSPLRIHDLRHTAVSLWIADGAHPKQIAVMAGHTSVSVVLDRYGHLYPQQDEELMDRLERRVATATS